MALLADVIIGAEEASVFETLIASGKVNDLGGREPGRGLRANLEIPATEYLKAMRIRSLLKQKFRELFAEVDVLIAPADTGLRRRSPSRSTDRTPYHRRFRPAGHEAADPGGQPRRHPALSMPCGFAGNLPVALQLAGPAFTENTLLALGREFQNRTDWHKRRPPLVS